MTVCVLVCVTCHLKQMTSFHKIWYNWSLPHCYIYYCSTIHYNSTDMWACEVVVLMQTSYVLLWENANKLVCQDSKETHADNSYLLREYTKY